MASFQVPVRFLVASYHCAHLLNVREDEGSNLVFVPGFDIPAVADCDCDGYSHSSGACWILFSWWSRELLRNCDSRHFLDSWRFDCIAITSLLLFSADRRTKCRYNSKRYRREWLHLSVCGMFTNILQKWAAKIHPNRRTHHRILCHFLCWLHVFRLRAR